MSYPNLSDIWIITGYKNNTEIASIELENLYDEVLAKKTLISLIENKEITILVIGAFDLIYEAKYPKHFYSKNYTLMVEKIKEHYKI